jgi:hypothetical protein
VSIPKYSPYALIFKINLALSIAVELGKIACKWLSFKHSNGLLNFGPGFVPSTSALKVGSEIPSSKSSVGVSIVGKSESTAPPPPPSSPNGLP